MKELEKPLISIIVPVYKVEKYLKRCVDSILTQTYQNMEVILVDDGSPDNCGAICDRYKETDNRVVVFIRKMAAYPMPEMRQFRWPRVSTLALLIAMIGFHPIMWNIYTRQLPNVMRILG